MYEYSNTYIIDVFSFSYDGITLLFKRRQLSYNRYIFIANRKKTTEVN